MYWSHLNAVKSAHGSHPSNSKPSQLVAPKYQNTKCFCSSFQLYDDAPNNQKNSGAIANGLTPFQMSVSKRRKEQNKEVSMPSCGTSTTATDDVITSTV